MVEMCGVDILFAKFRQRRLRCFGHVERARGGVLNEVRELKFEGRRPSGRPKKTWSGCVTEDMDLLEIKEHMAEDRKLWGTVIARPTPL